MSGRSCCRVRIAPSTSFWNWATCIGHLRASFPQPIFTQLALTGGSAVGVGVGVGPGFTVGVTVGPGCEGDFPPHTFKVTKATTASNARRKEIDGSLMSPLLRAADDHDRPGAKVNQCPIKKPRPH